MAWCAIAMRSSTLHAALLTPLLSVTVALHARDGTRTAAGVASNSERIEAAQWGERTAACGSGARIRNAVFGWYESGGEKEKSSEQRRQVSCAHTCALERTHTCSRHAA